MAKSVLLKNKFHLPVSNHSCLKVFKKLLVKYIIFTKTDYHKHICSRLYFSMAIHLDPRLAELMDQLYVAINMNVYSYI